jgi:hypothetical protein
MGGLSKKKFGRILIKIFRVSNWKIALILVLLGFLAATLLRFDHIKMTELREAVLAADAEDDEEKTIAALNELRAFTVSHIVFNTIEENGVQKITFGTGPFYLENMYLKKANEAVAKAQEEIQKNSSNPNGNIYQKVAEVCDAQGIKYGWRYPDKRYINCWMEEIATYPTEETMDAYGAATLPSTELFRYEFASPIWYPCWSGIVILICVILLIIFIIRFIIWFVIQIALIFVKRSK